MFRYGTVRHTVPFRAVVPACLVLLVCLGAPVRCFAQSFLGIQSYPGEYVVTLAPQSRRLALGGQNIAAMVGGVQQFGTVLRELAPRTVLMSADRVSRVSGQSGRGIASMVVQQEQDYQFCKQLIAQGVAESCTPNYRLTTSQVAEIDPLLVEQWGISNEAGVGALSAWEVSRGSDTVVVAVIDTGVDYNHPDLAAHVWVNPGEVPGNGIDDDANGYIDDVHGANTSVWAANKGDPFDDNQHGTHVAGIIGALNSNGIGISGISPAVTIIPIKFMDSNGAGRLSDAIAAIDYMIDLKVNRGVNIRVANNSWGGGGYSPALYAAIQRANDAGIVFVAAAGNSATDLDLFPSYPASYEVQNVITVAAMDRNQNLASFSNYGAESVDIAAPGVEIVSTLPNGGYGALSGTSMSTPHVTGSLALLFAVEPTLSVQEAIARVLESGRDLAGLVTNGGTTPLVGSRRGLDAARLVRNQTALLPSVDGDQPACGYTFESRRLGSLAEVDRSADRAPIVNQVDEGGFYRIDLPFEFPFFRAKTSTLYVSPNGLVYLNEPKNPDYQVALRAPNNSVAAFQTDLTPRTAAQGVRVYTDLERVTVYWSSEHYSLMGRGPLSVRLTLFNSGMITSTITFESVSEPEQASRVVLGDPFIEPSLAALGIIGASATSSRISNTFDLAGAKRALTSPSDPQLDLHVSMIPNCFTIQDVESKLSTTQVDKIQLRLSKGNKRIVANFSGVGSGAVPIVASVNGKQCSQAAWVNLRDGMGRAQIPLLASVSKVALKSSAAHKSVSLRGMSSKLSRSLHSRQCERLVSALSR